MLATAGIVAALADIAPPTIAPAANNGVFATFRHSTDLTLGGTTIPTVNFEVTAVRFNAAGALKAAGAEDVVAYCTHGVLSGKGLWRPGTREETRLDFRLEVASDFIALRNAFVDSIEAANVARRRLDPRRGALTCPPGVRQRCAAWRRRALTAWC